MNRISRFGIKNFKSLLDFEITFPLTSPLTLLIGLNGSGKSTVLQAFDFVGELMRGNIQSWVNKRGWKTSDLVTRIHSSRSRLLIEISLEGEVDSHKFSWQATYNPKQSLMRCTQEKLYISDGYEKEYLIVKDGKLTINDLDITVNFSYSGSILSQLNTKLLSAFPGLQNIKNFVSSIQSFDLLAPNNIRMRRSRVSDSIGMGGDNLAGFIAGLELPKRAILTRKLREFYPWISECGIKGYQFGWKELKLYEKIGRYEDVLTHEFHNYKLSRPSQHINDGSLRLIAILSVILFQKGLTLLDEIENGFNPHIIRRLVDLLYTSKSQLIVTTHSPEILQYIPKEYTQDSVKLLFRNEDATSGVVDFFSIPDASNKLKMLSPGEVFLDIELEKLAKELGKQPVNN